MKSFINSLFVEKYCATPAPHCCLFSAPILVHVQIPELCGVFGLQRLLPIEGIVHEAVKLSDVAKGVLSHLFWLLITTK